MGVRGWLVVFVFSALTLAGLGAWWRSTSAAKATVRIDARHTVESGRTTERTTRALQKIQTTEAASEANDLIRGAQDEWPPR